MCYDKRFPHLEPLARAGIPRVTGIDAKRVRVACAEIARRTGTNPFYNRISHAVLFVYGDEPHGGPMQLPLTDRPITQGEIDSAVEYMQLGKASRREKDHWAEKQRLAEKAEHEQSVQARLAERRPDAISYARHLDETRRGVKRTTVAL